MNFLNKKTRNKIIAQALIGASVFGIGIGYDLTFNEDSSFNINVSALDISVGVSQVTCGSANTVFMKNDGTVWATGLNNYGQLGIGNTTSQNSPVQIPITNVKNVICGQYHTIFIKNDGTVWATGSNADGQLGIGNTTNQLNPVKVPITDVKNISCGYNFTVFIKNDGTIWATGSNADGQLGIGNTTSQVSPIQVSITGVNNVVCGNFYTMFTKNDGTVWATGFNSSGQLGIGDTYRQNSPVQVPITGVKNVICGGNHTVFTKNDGTIWTTGSNANGELGIGNTTSQVSPIQVSITGVNNVVCGNAQTMFLKNDGTVWATGYNLVGQLGIGNTTNQLNPVQVSITGVNNVACGSYQTVFMKNDGTVWSTGYNANGELGIGNTTQKKSPVQVSDTWLAKDYLTDATTKITNAETTKTQANVDLAQTAINLLPTGTDKTALQTRLDVVKNYLSYQSQLATATNSVTKAESSKLQADVDSAKVLVNALTNVTDKTNLTNRLTIVQTAIDKAKQDALSLANATAKVTNAETKSDVDSAQTAIDALPNDANKTDLQNQLDIIKAQIAFTDATSAVTKAEDSKLQADVDSAKTLVDALTNVTDKTNLTNRLTVVQTIIYKAKQDALNLTNATTKVTTAETTKTQSNVDLAQTAINLLPTGTDKTALQSKLDIVKNYIAYQAQLATATNSVTKAEGSKLQADVDSATILVNSLTNVTDKTNLTNRLTVVQTIIDKAKQYALNLTGATTKVTTAETTKTQSNVDLAQTDINLLPTGTDKTALQTRLDVVKNYIVYQTQLTTVTNAVVKAEGSKLQADVDSAKTLVNVLTNVTDKTNLINRLTTVQTTIDKAKQDALNLTDVIAKVTTAETTKTQANVDSAKGLVNALPDGSTKTDLLNRLNVVQTILNAQPNPDENDKQLTTATNLVKNAESSKDTISILKAQNAINNLKNSSDKTELQNRLDALKEKQQQENNLNIEFKDATEKIRWAEAYVTNNNVNKYIVSAQASIDKLPNCSEKTALQDRIAKVKNQIKNNSNSALKMQAEPLVRQAELFKKSQYYVRAWDVVNQMSASDIKTSYMDRLKALGSDMEVK